jgi:small-conductance mechanosensitive channel
MRWLDFLHIPREFRWTESVIVIAVAVMAALVAHFVAIRFLRLATRAKYALVVERIRAPLRWFLIAVFVGSAARVLPISRSEAEVWRAAAGFLVPALLGWLALAFFRALLDIVTIRADITVEDNLHARRKRTRALILGRIGSSAIVFITICLMLLSVPGIRSIGVTLMASAGVAGLVVGAAAQPALKNLIAGIQLAFTEPIRLDDVVIVDSEWGRVEEITLTYVVVRIWDDRRLVVPVSKFLEQSFQNWTRETSALLGSVFWYLDPATDMGRVREQIGRLVQASPLWDGRFWNAQVTDVKAEAIELRALMTAKNASAAFDLRCEVREGLLAWLRAEMPEALPRTRVLMAGESSMEVQA